MHLRRKWPICSALCVVLTQVTVTIRLYFTSNISSYLLTLCTIAYLFISIFSRYIFLELELALFNILQRLLIFSNNIITKENCHFYSFCV